MYFVTSKRAGYALFSMTPSDSAKPRRPNFVAL